MSRPFRKIALFMVPTGIVLLFLPIWIGPPELAPAGVMLLLGGLLLFNKARSGSVTGRRASARDGQDFLDWGPEAGENPAPDGGEFGGGGASGDWDDAGDD